MTSEDLLIEAILTIGNDKKSVAMLEPSVMQPLQLERWMVTRTLQCLELILEEVETAILNAFHENGSQTP